MEECREEFEVENLPVASQDGCEGTQSHTAARADAPRNFGVKNPVLIRNVTFPWRGRKKTRLSKKPGSVESDSSHADVRGNIGMDLNTPGSPGAL